MSLLLIKRRGKFQNSDGRLPEREIMTLRDHKLDSSNALKVMKVGFLNELFVIDFN